MALDRGATVGARFCGGYSLRVGLWMDGSRNARTGRAAEEPGRCRFLQICEKPHVCRVLRGVDWIVGRFWTCERCGDPWYVRGRSLRSFVRATLRGADAGEEVRRAI